MANNLAHIDEDATVSVAENQVSSDLDGESVVLDLDQGIYYGMNELGSRVWQIIQNPVSVQEIIVTVQDEYEVDRERCKQDILSFLNQLDEQNLITISGRGTRD